MDKVWDFFRQLGGIVLLAASSVAGLLFLIPSGINSIRSVRTGSGLHGFHWPPTFVTAQPLDQLAKTLKWLDASPDPALRAQAWMLEAKHLPVAFTIGAVLSLGATVRTLFLTPKMSYTTPFGWLGLAILAEIHRPAWLIVLWSMGAILVIAVVLSFWSRWSNSGSSSYYGASDFPSKAWDKVLGLLWDYIVALGFWILLLGYQLFRGGAR